MTTPDLTTAHVEYLERTGHSPGALPDELSDVPRENRRLLLVREVGEPRTTSSAVGPVMPDGAAAMVVGLHAERIPLVFLLSGTPAGVRIGVGTWGDGTQADTRAEVLATLLHVARSAVVTEPVEPVQPALPVTDLVLGVPAPAAAGPGDPAPVDRLLRAMTGDTWFALTLAEPLDEGYTAQLRRAAIDELRAARAAAESFGAASPLGEHHAELAGLLITSLSTGLATGAWRAATYLGGTARSAPRLAAAWRAVFSGPDRVVEPLRIWRNDRLGALAAGWALPYVQGPPPPGRYRHPFEHQTLLCSPQLAAVVDLPHTETTGFRVADVPTFDVESRPPSGPALAIGDVVEGLRPTGSAYRVARKALTRHVFVAGVTGSGKSTTIRHLLDQLDAAGVPYLVIEPAKREYRSLRSGPAVYTVGDERVSPLRLNPFEVPPGINVIEHVDLVRSVFAASSGMWTPLPQVLERCLHQIYADRGFDPVTGANPRLRPGDDPAAAFPTLGQLCTTVARVVPTLGYDERVTADIRAALLTRLEALRAGGKGLMLDGRRSVPMDTLLGRPTVVELEPIADDDDKALVMGLLLTRLVEHRRAQGPAADLTHLLVVEEAHRLLAAPSGIRRPEDADPRGKAAETFGHLLAELRAYGQGVLVADQVPTKLLPDVLKNTGLKIAHRTVAADDRGVLAGAMAMDDSQAQALTALPAGRAVVFGEGDDAGVLVSVPAPSMAQVPTDADIGARADRQAELPYDDCTPGGCAADPAVCGLARRNVELPAVQRTLARLVLSAAGDPAAVDRLWPDLLAVVRPRTPRHVDEHLLLRSLAVHGASWLVTRRGEQAGWSHLDTRALQAATAAMLLARLDGPDTPADSAAGLAFRTLVHQLGARAVPPYHDCTSICRQEPPVCLYRGAVAELVESGEQAAAWARADTDDAVAGSGGRERSWEVALDAAYALIEFPEPEWPQPLRQDVSDRARRVALCFAQQMLDADPLKSARTNRKIMARILGEAGK